MDSQKTQTFIEKLSKETINSKIKWARATQYETMDYSSNPEVAKIFFSNEYCQIDFVNSYFASIQSGTIYIIFENINSGRNGICYRNYKLYIKTSDNKVSPLSCKQEVICQLVNSIKSYLAREDQSLENFIDSYLSSSEVSSEDIHQ